ncbi:carbohydrate porin [Mangrovibacterium diazotrophicum]|uniref:OprB family porin n=1 Tax=Mangrovibacterium diazotrophicum TaxID=1261403 RepID=A0A419W890_9BACT|nr:carbohydrate porin [Mangrovibacterium diazotrophicum]RKD91582.1 OprB family porin [Mangrovibacterium diazotrophicum]
MKNLLCIGMMALALFTTGGAFAGADEAEKQPALSFYGGYKGDFVSNLNGGIKTGSTYLGLADLFLELNTENAGLWKGGTFMLHGANTHGGEPSADLIGDFQVVSNIEAGNHTFLYELWYCQTFGNFHTTIGLQDLNAEFANSEFGGLFINSSFGIHSIIADNIAAPIFPLTSPGITICWEATSRLNLKTAIYKGCPIDFDDNPYNLKWDLNYSDALLWVAEANFHCSADEDCAQLIKVGTFYHQHCEDETVSDDLESDYGFYVVGDHRVSPAKEYGKGLSVFYQLGVSPRNDNVGYIGTGIHYTGLFSQKGKDTFGLAMAKGVMNKDAGKDETTFELTYKLQLNDYIYFQPDIQYVINPRGTDATLDNALVGLFRLGLEF